jgi:hypothetical protein
MSESNNRNNVELHGCIVFGKLFNILTIYDPGGTFLYCTVTSPDGHVVKDERQPLVACDTHSTQEIDAAHKRWQSNIAKNKNE